MATRILQDFEVAGEVEEDDGSTSEQNARFLEVEFSGSVRCLADQPDAEDRELIAMDVCLGLLYEVAAECAEDGIDEFVRMNVPYHAIPYWREHIHGVCAKRRFRPITVPMYIQAMQQGEPRVVEKAED
ncbi:hypothetical protein N799_09940 [Lysobacter arseniciresistens ZS79]|uniref:Preprotein translocase subunit SecB n=2 Tax=Novilysobacter TaxID=3382699 RepID=A0A0A0ETB0_9GAMM|nr:hypothetical protein N799_09940 [Lysobacter arseniciresistens ZS79]